MTNADFDLVISDGLVVTPDGSHIADVGVVGEKIVEIGPGLAHRSRTVVSATGKVVMPGIIDAHVHCRTWTDHADEIAVSHRAAAFGGVTTALTQIRPTSDMQPADAIKQFIDLGEQVSPIDFGLHTILRPEHDLKRAIPEVIALGSPSVKFFMSYKETGVMVPDGELLQAFEIARDNGALAMVHAEDGELISYLIAKSRSLGRTSIEDFAAAEPAGAEDLATVKALVYAAAVDCPLYILHMTTAGSARALEEAQARGQRAWGETCPKYLTLTNDDLIRRGPLAKVGPPLRSQEDLSALWSGVTAKSISVIASDHAPKDRERFTSTDDIFSEPDGAPGTETLLPITYDEMVVKRQLPLTDLVNVLSTNPAKIYGLYPQKGVLAPGSDADIVIVDPAKATTITAAGHHSTALYSLYENREVGAWPVASFVRGRQVLRGDELAQDVGGRYLARKPEDLLQLKPGSLSE